MNSRSSSKLPRSALAQAQAGLSWLYSQLIQPPTPTRESFFSAASNYDGSTVEHSSWPHHKLATHKHFPLSQFLTQAGLLTIIMVIFLSDPTLAY